MESIDEFFFFVSDDDEAFRVHEHRDLSLTETHNVLQTHGFSRVAIVAKIGRIFGSFHIIEGVSEGDDFAGVVVVLEGHGVSLLLPLLYQHDRERQQLSFIEIVEFFAGVEENLLA